MANAAAVAVAAIGQTTNNWKTVGGREQERERERGDTLHASCAHLKFPLKKARQSSRRGMGVQSHLLCISDMLALKLVKSNIT